MIDEKLIYALCEDIQDRHQGESEFDRGMRFAAKHIAKGVNGAALAAQPPAPQAEPGGLSAEFFTKHAEGAVEPTKAGLGAVELARMFHDRYETLAPAYGYETRPDTKTFDPHSKNGRLMVAVIRSLRAALATSSTEGAK